jgi:integrase
MASICNDGGGLKRILVVCPDGKRRPIRLGKMTMKQAEAFNLHVERLVVAPYSELPTDTAKWLADLDDKMHARLAAVGLAKPRRFSTMTLGPFIDAYIADRTDAKPRTIINLKQARKDAVEFFKPDRALRDISEGEADEFWRYLLRRGLGTNTAKRICGRMKQFFRAAIRKRLVQANPFADIKSHVQGNPQRDFFITREMAEKAINACPDAEWKLIFALSRFGGLRCPSEHLALRWGDVDWEHNRITVHSPKTEHHEGKESRQLPIFPELRPYLLEVFEQAEEGSEYVITRYRDANVNLRTQLQRIISKAGLEAWPKLFHNLRATRQTELAETYPMHVVCAWIGNSAAIAQEHYLQVTDDHFAKAIKDPSQSGDEKAAHNQAQSAAVTAGMSKELPKPQKKNRPVLPSDSEQSRYLHISPLPPRGVEPLSAG